MGRRGALAAVAAAIALIAAATAFAAQVNTYSVKGSTKPAKAGSKKHPKPIALKFSYSVGEQSGLRPSPVKRYTIGFYGVRDNGRGFPACSARKINAAGDDSVCSKKAVVGTGSVHNLAGNTADPSNTSLKCDLGLTIYNGGQGKAALFLHGAPPQCVVTISQAIDARYVKFKGGTALQFTVPSSLLHPLNGIDNAVVNVTSKIKKRTAKGHGYFESFKCKGSKRPIQVTFLTEAGQTSKARTNAKC